VYQFCSFVVDLDLELKNMVELELEPRAQERVQKEDADANGWAQGIFLFLEDPFSLSW
jgi:hypothetical protein